MPWYGQQSSEICEKSSLLWTNRCLFKSLIFKTFPPVHGISLRRYVDAGGIVFYANYLKFFERARTEWLRSLGIGQQTLREQTGGMFVVSETTLKYHRPARLDDELLVTARLQESGRASLTIAQQAWRKTGSAPELLCEGSIRIGWVSAASMKPERIPSTVLEAIQ